LCSVGNTNDRARGGTADTAENTEIVSSESVRAPVKRGDILRLVTARSVTSLFCFSGHAVGQQNFAQHVPQFLRVRNRGLAGEAGAENR
jgi:hypothetical protein